MLHSSIGIGIARGQYYWILGASFGIVLTLFAMKLFYKTKAHNGHC